MSKRPVQWDLDDMARERELDEQENQFKQQKESVGVQRAQLEQKKKRDWDTEEQALRKRMEELEFQSKLDDQYIWDAKDRISSFKHQIKQVETKQESKQDGLFESKRLMDMENVVRKKLELERIQKEKAQILANREKEEDKLKAIDEEKNRRDVANLNNLEKILHKADMLDKAIRNGEWDKQNAAIYATSLAENESAQSKDLLEKWLATKRLEVADMTDLRIKELEAQRDELLRKEEEVVRRKELHNRSKQRGPEFMQQQEMNPDGRLSDHESLAGDFSVETDEEDEIAVKDVVQAAKQSVNPLQSRIQDLREMKKRTDALNRYLQRPYNGEEDIRKLKPDLDYSTYVAATMLVHEIVDRAWEKIAKEMQEREDLERYREYYNHKIDVYDQRIEFYQSKHAPYDIVNDLVEESLEELLNEIGDEVIRIGNFAENIVGNFLALALKEQRKLQEPDEDIKHLLVDLANARGGELSKMTHQLYKRTD